MKLLFRQISERWAPPPAKGEIYIYPVSPDPQQRRHLATLVVQSGLACLRQGPGPIELIVVRADPTLDEMLAALFVGELVANRPLPAAAAAFAGYAALVRDGLAPGSVPLQISMQGIFKAIRRAAGDDLTNPVAARRFAADWERMARVVMEAMNRRDDPLTTSAFAEGSEFARERTFLARDLDVYRQDVLRGEQWVVGIPEGPPGGRALLLRRPKSLLYTQWSRGERGSDSDQSFVFLAVANGSGEWIFSTDPVQQLPLQSLAAALQAAEIKKDSSAQHDPWFDGEPFAHTLVAAPHGGSKLSDRKVLAIVRSWSHARQVAGPKLRWKPIAAAAALLAAVGLSIGPVDHWLWPKPVPVPINGETSNTHGRPGQNSNYVAPALPAGGKNYALMFATETYDYEQKKDDLGNVVQQGWAHLNNPIHDATSLGEVLSEQYGFIVKQFPNQKQLDIQAILDEWYKSSYYGRDSELLIYFTCHGYLDPVKKRPFVVAADSLYAGTAAQIERTCISLDELAGMFPTMPCRHILLVLDTCYAGTIDYGVALSKTKGKDDAESIGVDNFKELKLRNESRLCLASTGNADSSDGPPGQHSPFAQRILDFFDREKTAPAVTINTLYDDISWLKGETPHFSELTGDEGGTFLFVHH